MIADSVNQSNNRISTMELTYPRFIHSEVLTHRDRARNSGSSRAIPWVTMCERIMNDPVIPIEFGREQKGMSCGDNLVGLEKDQATLIWLKARDQAVLAAQELASLGVHKSICNRLTEPFMWITVVMTATRWANFFRQRCHPDAEIHMQRIAHLMRGCLNESKPILGDYHLPYVDPGECESVDDSLKVSTARCARVSYVQHGNKARSVEADLALWSRLKEGSGFGHFSPFEHPAISSKIKDFRSGPYTGWESFRHTFANEDDPG